METQSKSPPTPTLFHTFITDLISTLAAWTIIAITVAWIFVMSGFVVAAFVGAIVSAWPK